MKYFLIFSVVFVAVYGVSEEYHNKMKIKMAETAAICIPETGANDDDIAELIARKTPTRKEGKCMMSCFMKKFGLQGEDGLPSKVGAMAFLESLHDDDEEMYKKMIQIALKCGPEVSETVKTDHCDIALEIVECTMREGKLVGLDDPIALQG